MRIGTWNLAGRWSARHLAMLTAADCDVWLLTEVNDRLAIADYTGHVTETPMRPKVSWAGIFSRTPLEPLADPNPASAMVRIGDTTFVCSILPWRGDNHAARTRHALDTLLEAMPGGDLCWGGDWNHAFSGPAYADGKGGREAITRAVGQLGMTVATADLPHVLDGLLSPSVFAGIWARTPATEPRHNGTTIPGRHGSLPVRVGGLSSQTRTVGPSRLRRHLTAPAAGSLGVQALSAPTAFSTIPISRPNLAPASTMYRSQAFDDATSSGVGNGS
jgi:hypothetical protein